jgi:hypothetical protein
MKEIEYVRRDNKIFTAAGALFKDCGSINAAKLMSRSLQKQGHGVKADKVEKPKPKITGGRKKLHRAKAPVRNDARDVAEQARILGKAFGVPEID